MTSAPDAADLLARAADRFVTAGQRIPAEQWLTRPAKGGWSTSEVVEHVVIASKRMCGVFDRLAPLDGPLAFLDEEIPFAFYGGDEPPGVADPTGEWTDIAAAYERLYGSIDALRERAATTADLRALGAPHIVFGLLDGVQWLLFAFAHTERHRGDLRQLAREFSV